MDIGERRACILVACARRFILITTRPDIQFRWIHSCLVRSRIPNDAPPLRITRNKIWWSYGKGLRNFRIWRMDQRWFPVIFAPLVLRTGRKRCHAILPFPNDTPVKDVTRRIIASSSHLPLMDHWNQVHCSISEKIGVLRSSNSFK